MDPIPRLAVFLAVTFVLLMGNYSVMQAATDEAINQNAYLQVRRIATVINLVASAPDGTTYRLDMPARKCFLLITKDSVKLDVTGTKPTSDVYGLITPSGITGNHQFDCRETQSVIIKKTSSGLAFEG